MSYIQHKLGLAPFRAKLAFPEYIWFINMGLYEMNLAIFIVLQSLQISRLTHPLPYYKLNTGKGYKLLLWPVTWDHHVLSIKKHKGPKTMYFLSLGSFSI